MHFRQREVAEHEAQPTPEMPLHRLDDRVGLPAERTLVVAVLDEGRLRIRWSLNVIAIADGKHEPGDSRLTGGHGRPLYGAAAGGRAGRRSRVAVDWRVLLAGSYRPPRPFVSDSSASRMPSAPGFTPTGDR